MNNLRIVQLLGDSAWAAVYEAEQLSSQRPVAVKVFKRASEQSAQGLLDELRALSAVLHPNIVEVFELGLSPDGAPFMVMELLVGESLAQRLARAGRLSVNDALDVAQQIAQALEAAHEAGVTHRALGPDDVFLARDPHLLEREVVKVLGFGAARLRPELPVPPPTGSAAARALAYTAPEQCRGASDLVDRRADVYALGAILYELLSGRPPFVAETAGDMMLQHMNAPPPPLPADLDGISVQIERALQQALAKEPRARFATMAAFSAAFGRPLPRISFPASDSSPGRAAPGLALAGADEGVSILPSPLLPPGAARAPSLRPGGEPAPRALAPTLWLALAVVALLAALIASERMRPVPASSPVADKLSPPARDRSLAGRPGTSNQHVRSATLAPVMRKPVLSTHDAALAPSADLPERPPAAH